MIKTLFIDLDDTLWATQENNKVALEELYVAHNWSQGYPSFEELYQRYYPNNEYLWHEYREGRIDKRELTIRRFSFFLETFSEVTEESILRLNDEFLELTSIKRGVVDGALELLEYLHPRYKIVIVSNGFIEVQHRKMESAGITPFVDHVVLSEDVGVSKPAKGIMEYALNISRSRRSESLFIGDSWEADIRAAQNVGIPSIWFNPSHKHSPMPLDEYPYPIYEVSTLKEVIPMLRRVMIKSYYL